MEFRIADTFIRNIIKLISNEQKTVKRTNNMVI